MIQLSLLILRQGALSTPGSLAAPLWHNLQFEQIHKIQFPSKFTNIFWVMGQFHFSCTLALPTVINILRSKKTSIVSKWFCERLFVLRLPYWLNQDIFRNVQTRIENALVGSLCDLFYIFWNASLHWVDRQWRSQPLWDLWYKVHHWTAELSERRKVPTFFRKRLSSAPLVPHW